MLKRYKFFFRDFCFSVTIKILFLFKCFHSTILLRRNTPLETVFCRFSKLSKELFLYLRLLLNFEASLIVSTSTAAFVYWNKRGGQYWKSIFLLKSVLRYDKIWFCEAVNSQSIVTTIKLFLRIQLMYYINLLVNISLLTDFNNKHRKKRSKQN